MDTRDLLERVLEHQRFVGRVRQDVVPDGELELTGAALVVGGQGLQAERLEVAVECAQQAVIVVGPELAVPLDRGPAQNEELELGGHPGRETEVGRPLQHPLQHRARRRLYR